MKKQILSVLALAAAATTGYVVATAQNNNLQVPAGQQPAAQQLKLARVATLNSIEANQEFQRNVQVMQQQRENAARLQREIDGTSDRTRKAELQRQLDAVMAKLNEDNQTMVRTYGFSLTRNYSLVVEKAHLFMVVSDEEAAQIERAQQQNATPTAPTPAPAATPAPATRSSNRRN